jgi:hypothetical protein
MVTPGSNFARSFHFLLALFYGRVTISFSQNMLKNKAYTASVNLISP